MSDANRPMAGARAGAWLVLVPALLGALAIVLAPMGIIQPFRAQTPRGVHLSYVLSSWSPSVTLALLLAAIAAAAILMRRSRRWHGRAGAAMIVLALGGAAWLARQNHFEWMFHPIDSPRFEGPGAAHGLADGDLVLGVSAAGASRAYPVKVLAYHHVLNDEVGDRAVVATY